MWFYSIIQSSPETPRPKLKALPISSCFDIARQSNTLSKRDFERKHLKSESLKRAMKGDLLIADQYNHRIQLCPQGCFRWVGSVSGLVSWFFPKNWGIIWYVDPRLFQIVAFCFKMLHLVPKWNIQRNVCRLLGPGRGPKMSAAKKV